MKEFYFPSGITADELASGLRAEDSSTRDADIFVLAKKFLEMQAELEAIKKQDPLCVVENKNLAKLADGKQATVRGCAPHMLYNPHYHLNLFAKPVYQHSFTVDGHTFYADNEVDILYLERKFGVGGKAKLNLVEDK